MPHIERAAEASWTGDLRNGTGSVSTGSGVLKNQHYTFGTRFEDAPGTNPEELIAAAHAACYSMAFAHTLSEHGYEPDSIETHVTASLRPQPEGGFRIAKMHLDVRASVPDIDEAHLWRLAREADKGCPVSNALRGGPLIELVVGITESTAANSEGA
jgi:osmotically inducible protein OsmC